MNEISDTEREKIRKEAQGILSSFSKAISKIKLKYKKNNSELSGFRKEGLGSKQNADFRKRMFENAPNKDGDNIIAEKKSW